MYVDVLLLVLSLSSLTISYITRIFMFTRVISDYPSILQVTRVLEYLLTALLL